jgi:CYTH domain-containing protein
MQTITRKFLVKKLPDLSKLNKISSSRFYLYISEDTVIRIQNTSGKYELERKFDKSDLVREEQKIEIEQREFEYLSKLSEKHTSRDSYFIMDKSNIILRIYHEDYEGLVRAEASFLSVKEAEMFVPLGWFDKEITNSQLAKERTLLSLSKKDFQKLLSG